MSGLTVDPAVGLPSGHPVLGSVTDGIVLPYALNLGGATTAHLVLTLDGTTVADVASGPARGTITVPGRTPGLVRGNDVAVKLTALGANGSTVTSAQTVGAVTDGTDLGVLVAFNPNQTPLADGGTLYLNQGASLRLQATAHTRMANAGIRAYDLTVDGTSILDDPTVADRPDQWVSGTWTAPATSGTHTLVYWASADGDSSRTAQTVTISVQPTGTFAIDGMDMNYNVVVEAGAAAPCTGTLKVASTYAPVANAPVQVLWCDATGTDWAPVATATTDAQGKFSTSLTPAVSGSYQLSTTGVPGVVGATTSPTVRVDLQAHVRLSVDQRRVGVGSTLTFTVTAPPAMSGVDAMLQLWNGMCWVTVAFGPLDRTGSATITYAPPLQGSYRFGALSGYSEQYAPTASDDLTVSVG